MTQLSLDFGYPRRAADDGQQISDVQGIPLYSSQRYQNLYDMQGLGIKVVREKPDISDRVSISRPADAVELLKPLYEGLEKEYFVSVILNARNQAEGIDLVSVGSLNASLVHPREVFRLPVILSAASVIISHNHPSGSPEPSREDISLTKRLQQAGDLLGIELLDHLVYANGGRYLSMKEAGLF